MKVGDRVRVVSDADGGVFVGREGTVTYITPDTHWGYHEVRLDQNPPEHEPYPGERDPEITLWDEDELEVLS